LKYFVGIPSEVNKYICLLITIHLLFHDLVEFVCVYVDEILNQCEERLPVNLTLITSVMILVAYETFLICRHHAVHLPNHRFISVAFTQVGLDFGVSLPQELSLIIGQKSNTSFECENLTLKQEIIHDPASNREWQAFGEKTEHPVSEEELRVNLQPFKVLK